MGVVIALAFIAPIGTGRRDVYVPFEAMLAATALYAVVWTHFVCEAPLFKPEPVEAVLQRARIISNPPTPG